MKTSHIVPLPMSPTVQFQSTSQFLTHLALYSATSQLHSPLMIIEQCLTVTPASALSTLGFIPSDPWVGLSCSFPGDGWFHSLCFLCDFSSGRTFQCREVKEALSTCHLSLPHAAVGCTFFIVLLLK